jgi:hypothetical protein
MEDDILAQTLSENKSRIIRRPCAYVITAPVVQEKTPAEKAMTNVLARQDRMVNLGGQQARTLDKKQKFLEVYADQACGIITRACKLSGIKSRKTIYNWIESDPDFKKAMENMGSIKQDFVDDLLTAQMVRGDGPSIRYFLDKRHPAYKRRRSNKISNKISEADTEFFKMHGLPIA